MNMTSKLLGCLVGAAAGDALGAATEMRTRKQIEERFKGYVRDFIEPPEDTFARGSRAGKVTDDFSLAYVSVLTILEAQGKINETVAQQSLINWSHTDFFEQYAGPTTRVAIKLLLNLDVIQPHSFLVNDNGKATNGAAMKIAPIALFSQGDVDQAILDACQMSKVSHDNQLSISAACAIAAATAEAMNDNASINSILEAGLYGAQKGEQWGMTYAKTLAGPSVFHRIQWAIKIGQKHHPRSELLDELSDLIGSGIAASEAIPCVFGIITAFGDNVEEAILAGVNIGNDTDTIATMVGGILGAFYGIEALPKHYQVVLEKENDYDFMKIAQAIEATYHGK